MVTIEGISSCITGMSGIYKQARTGNFHTNVNYALIMAYS